MDANAEFLKALSMIEEIVLEPIEYRLHYNELGEIIMCSMQQHPVDTQYVVVTKEEYDNYFRYNVVNGAIKLIDKPTAYNVQLKKSDSGYKVVKNHASIILEDDAYTDVEYYDTTN